MHVDATNAGKQPCAVTVLVIVYGLAALIALGFFVYELFATVSANAPN